MFVLKKMTYYKSITDSSFLIKNNLINLMTYALIFNKNAICFINTIDELTKLFLIRFLFRFLLD